MNSAPELNHGEQPIARLMAKHALKPSALVAASTEQITFKMITRACKGRRLTPRVQAKILRALNQAAGQKYARTELFNY